MRPDQASLDQESPCIEPSAEHKSQIRANWWQRVTLRADCAKWALRNNSPLIEYERGRLNLEPHLAERGQEGSMDVTRFQLAGLKPFKSR